MDGFTSADKPARSLTAEEKTHYAAQSLAREYVGGLLSSLSERYFTNDSKTNPDGIFLEHGCFAALLHPLLSAVDEVMHELVLAVDGEGILVRFKTELESTLEELDAKRAKQIMEPAMKKTKPEQKVGVMVTPTQISMGSKTFSAPVTTLPTELHSSISYTTRAEILWQDYRKSALQFWGNIFPPQLDSNGEMRGAQVSEEQLWHALGDDEVFEKFWQGFATRISGNPDVDALVLMVERYCAVPGANAATERMGSTGR